MQLDMAVNVWSRGGSYLQVRRKRLHDPFSPLMYQTVRLSVWRSLSPGVSAADFFRFELNAANGEPAPYQHTATVERLTLRSADAMVEMAFADEQTLALSVSGKLMLVAEKVMGWVAHPTPDQILIYDRHAGITHHVRLLRGGRMEIRERVSEAPVNGRPNTLVSLALIAPPGERLEALVRSCAVETRLDEEDLSVDEAAARTASEWSRWRAARPEVSDEFEAAANYAWHTLWHHRVSPEGHFKRPAIIMGRLWMNMTWPWDACFAALGIGAADVDLAFDQVMVHLDHQAPTGQLPDHVHDGEASYGWLKPPVQGWILRQLIDSCGLDACRHRLGEVYEPLVHWTEWWYRFRDDDRDGMCQYNHGNDSGWDNATVFDGDMPVEGVDLAAYLVLQWETLADIADILGRRPEAERWRERAAGQLKALLQQGVVYGRLASISSSRRRLSRRACCSRSSVMSRWMRLMSCRDACCCA